MSTLALRSAIRAVKAMTRRLVTFLQNGLYIRVGRQGSQANPSCFEHLILQQSGAVTHGRRSPWDIVLIRSGARDKWLQFACPNRCGIMITLDLSPTRTPHWSVVVNTNGTVS